MSLIVTTFKRDPESGKLIDDPFQENGKDIAGPESWRTDIWGNDATIEMGATYLPQLKHTDLYIENDQLQGFRNECTMLLLNINEFSEKLGIDSPQSIVSRLGNMIDAIEKAISINGGVYIG